MEQEEKKKVIEITPKEAIQKGKKVIKFPARILLVIFIVLLTLKVAGVGTAANMSWFWVFFPIMLPIIVIAAVVAIFILIMIIAAVASR